jgi:hypothetical protein
MVSWDLLSPATWFSSDSSRVHRSSECLSREYSVHEMERLHSLLLHEDKLLGGSSSRSLSTLSSGHQRHRTYIEALRAISEIVVWADQRKESEEKEGSAIVEYFLSKRMIGYFHEILLSSGDDEEVVVQVLQTINILIQNLRNQQTIYCIFSNNYVCDILSMDKLFLGRAGSENDDEVLGLYVNLLKTIAMRLDESSIEFFMDESKRECVLYTKAMLVTQTEAAQTDGMVRAAIRAVVLKLASILHSSECLLGENTRIFFDQLSGNMGSIIREMELVLRESKEIDGHRIRYFLEQLEDDMAFLNDIVCTPGTKLGQIGLKAIWRPIILGALSVVKLKGDLDRDPTPKLLGGLLILETASKSLACPTLMDLLVSLLLSGNSVEAAENILTSLGNEYITINDLLGTAVGHRHSDMNLRDIRSAFLSTLSSGGPHCAVVSLKIIACILNGKTRDHVLCTVGLLPFEVEGEPCESTGHLGSHPIRGGDLFESENSLFYPERYLALQQAIFSTLEIPRAESGCISLQIMTQVSWIVHELLHRKAVLLDPQVGLLQDLLARSHDQLVAKIPQTALNYAIPMVLGHCWNAQKESLELMRPMEDSLELFPPSHCNQEFGSLSDYVFMVRDFIVRYQLNHLVLKGSLGEECPFPQEPLAPTLSQAAQPIEFLTSKGILWIENSKMVVQDEASGIIFDAPLSSVTMQDVGCDQRCVSLSSRQAQVVGKRILERVFILDEVQFSSRLDRKYVESTVANAHKELVGLSQVFLEQLNLA